MLRTHFSSYTLVLLITAVFTISCTAQQTEEQALESLRQMTKDGKLPPEAAVASIESRFAGKRTGALAKLLRARVRFENGDLAGAAAILNSREFSEKTAVADYALWYRGKTLQQAGNHTEAMQVFADLVKSYPDSLNATSAKILWAESAIKTGKSQDVPEFLKDLNELKIGAPLTTTARAYETDGKQVEAIAFYRRAYFFAPGSDAAKEAEAKLTSMQTSLAPVNLEEAEARADRLYVAKNYAAADKAFGDMIAAFPESATTEVHLKRLVTLASLKRMPDAKAAFDLVPANSSEKEEAYYQLVTGYARSRQFADARKYADEMRVKFPSGERTPKAFVEAGYAARDAKARSDESYFLNTAVVVFPDAVEVAGAQFELAWMQHESGNFSQSSQMLVDHLAKYAERDTTNRGKAGYWAARDSERAGKSADACGLYKGVIYRYSANWYGYLAQQRLDAMNGRGDCMQPQPSPQTEKAIASLKSITVAPETATARELDRAEKSEQLSTIGLFDWAINELEEAKKTAVNSPKINLALAKHYRLKGDNVSAFLALAKSYPDYSQMFPEEMGREEWDIFYPQIAWDQIAAWSKSRDLDLYQVAGLIRQESVFNPRAKSPANAYGLMQLILPTARSVARKYGSTATITVDALFQPALNIELGTGYMRDQLDKYGRIEYMAVAYNAGPGRVPQWRASLPIEIDEFVEAIPFRETKAYVQGVVRNTAQYRRLYDEKGNFRSNVGSNPLRSAIDSLAHDQFALQYPEVELEGSGH